MPDEPTQITRVVKVPRAEGILRPVRPIRDWLSIGCSRGATPRPIEVIGVLASALRAIEGQGTPVHAEAIWMDPDGNVELVLPAKGPCSAAACLASLGDFALEALAAPEPMTKDPAQRLAIARARTFQAHPCEWSAPLELALGRLVGVFPRYQSIREAAASLALLESSGSRGLELFSQLGYQPGLLHPQPQSLQPQSRSWVLPAAVGFGLAWLIIAGAWASYRLGQRHSVPPPGQAEHQQPRIGQGQVIVDAESLVAIAKALSVQPKPSQPERPVAVQSGSRVRESAKAKPADPEEGPVFVGNPDATERPLRVSDPNRVTSRDFVARK